MVSIRKIIIFLLFLNCLECLGQNIYDSNTIYYNMDTTRCVDQDARFWSGGELLSRSGNPDSVGLYCIHTKSVEIPIVKVNEDSIIYLVDSCINDAMRNNYLQFPDSSGFFVELRFFSRSRYSLRYEMAITPISNYYMGRRLSSIVNEFLNKFYGYDEMTLQGCFYLNNILCLIATYELFEYEKVSCLFSETKDKLRLELYSPTITKISDDDWSVLYRSYPNCPPNKTND